MFFDTPEAIKNLLEVINFKTLKELDISIYAYNILLVLEIKLEFIK